MAGRPPPKKKTEAIETIVITPPTRKVCHLHFIGDEREVILHKLSRKAERDLLFPPKKLTTSQKSHTLKHNVIREYRESMYMMPDDAPTAIGIPAPAFKAAMRNAAYDFGGKKAQIGRFLSVMGYYVPLYGIPRLWMANVVQQMTPEIRTRAIVPEWACQITVRYIVPHLNEKVIANLAAAAGMTQGVGDFRTEKGKGDFGQFRLCSPDDPDYVRIKKLGRKDQLAAILNPEAHDERSRLDYEWWKQRCMDEKYSVPELEELIRLGHWKSEPREGEAAA